MQLQITARHLNLTPSLADYVRKKIEKAQRYFDSILRTQAILQIQKHRHSAELIVHVPGRTFRVEAEASDLYSAIDLATHKLDLHLNRLKEKHHRYRKKRTPTLAKISRNSSGESTFEVKQEPHALFTEVRQLVPQPKNFQEALRELNSNGLPFSIFLNERTNQLNLIYRKKKDSYGLVEIVEAHESQGRYQ